LKQTSGAFLPGALMTFDRNTRELIILQTSDNTLAGIYYLEMIGLIEGAGSFSSKFNVTVLHYCSLSTITSQPVSPVHFDF
jgi:hypothetical protein